MNQNGQCTTKDTRGEQGWKAQEEGQEYLQFQTCPSSRETSGDKISRLIKFENSFQVKESVHLKANTTEEVEEKLLRLFPIHPYYIGMRFSQTREGTIHRKFIQGSLDPLEPTVYVKLYLKKH